MDADWKRWPIIILFALSNVQRGFQWLQYLSAASIIQTYYGISENLMTWTGTINMVVFTVLIVPFQLLTSHLGTRLMLLSGTLTGNV